MLRADGYVKVLDFGMARSWPLRRKTAIPAGSP